MQNLDIVSLSRLQFALTALYHFIFVPLTLGMSFLLAIMESVWVMTKRTIWRDMVKFWGTLFGINFAMGVATGITMEFQFGTNWAYYAHYVGDIFGAPLAIEGMMAFFLEATFVGMFFFGWDKLSRLQHLVCTWLLALGANFSALWILIANGWMQNPVGARFNVDTMRMEVTNFGDVIFNPVAQAKFVHTVSAGYVTGSVFIMAISAWYMLKGRHIEIAKRSMTVALSFGLASALSVVVLGDESGYTASQNQKMKVAAIEAVWHTESAPAGLTVFGIPDLASKTTHFEIKLPWLLGLIATRSIDTPVPGIADLVESNKERIRSGMIAYGALDQLRHDRDNADLLNQFNAHQQDLGYALLLKRHTGDVAHASDQSIDEAAQDTVPNVPVLFWSFRVMVALGFYFILLFAAGFYFACRRQLQDRRVFLKLAFWTLPLPWLSAELGWVVAEMGRQPWTIDGVLPTFLSVSSTTAANVVTSLVGFVLFYSILLIVEMFLMVKYIRLVPFPPPLLPMEETKMFDYEMLRVIWWGLLGTLLIGFAVLDGFDFGAAALIPFLGKNDEERRIIINTVGPVWEGNQVWLILGAGAIFAAWPYIYAVAFSGFYLAMFLALCMLILRPVSFKFRSKMPNPGWRRFWDICLCVSGTVPPIIFGVAVGNALLGVPFTFDDTMRMTYTGTLFGLLNPFGLLAGVISLLMILTQGSIWIALKTEEAVQARARNTAILFSILTLILFGAAGLWISGMDGYVIASVANHNGPSNPLLKTVVRESGAWLKNYGRLPISMFVPGLVLIGAAITWLAVAGRNYLGAFIGNSLTITGIVGTAGVSMFPFILPSSLNPNDSLTVWDASSSLTTLVVMTIVTVIFIPIIFAYTGWVYWVLRGKVTKAYIREQSGSVY